VSDQLHGGQYPAHPIQWGDGTTDIGLTKRELFAAMAMQGMTCTMRLTTIPYSGGEHVYLASAAVACADALLAELAKDPP
jgi:hypothetical protein